MDFICEKNQRARWDTDAVDISTRQVVKKKAFREQRRLVREGTQSAEIHKLRIAIGQNKDRSALESLTAGGQIERARFIVRPRLDKR